MSQAPVYYGEYLQLDKIIHAQEPVSFSPGHEPAHEEMLFIVIHQAYELWFKQILFEVDSVAQIMSQPSINDNSADLERIVHRLKRVDTILKVLVQQVDILETMTPMQFLEFRDLLRPASGFQSWQFKILEARLGLKFEDRFGQEYYLSQLQEKERNLIKDAELQPSVLNLLVQWLERMPFLQTADGSTHPFWQTYRDHYAASLAEAEKGNLQAFDDLFSHNHPERRLTATAARSAMFILLYRGYPMLELPFQLLDILIEIDNQLGNWRFRHINMVRRMIGTRIGTGGSTGAHYLHGAMEKHSIFRELSQLNSFLMNKKQIPALPAELEQKLLYRG